MKKKYDPEHDTLDSEEQWYEDHADEFIPVPQEERDNLISSARTTIQSMDNKTERMNIRMTKRDMEALKSAAIKEGLPYQSLVTSVLHKYMTGKLVDIDEARKILQST